MKTTKHVFTLMAACCSLGLMSGIAQASETRYYAGTLCQEKGLSAAWSGGLMNKTDRMHWAHCGLSLKDNPNFVDGRVYVSPGTYCSLRGVNAAGDFRIYGYNTISNYGSILSSYMSNTD